MNRTKSRLLWVAFIIIVTLMLVAAGITLYYASRLETPSRSGLTYIQGGIKLREHA